MESKPGPGKKKVKKPRSYWEGGRSGTLTERHAHAMRKVCSCCAKVIGLKEQEHPHRFSRVRIVAEEEPKLARPVLSTYISQFTTAAVVPTVCCAKCWKPISELSTRPKQQNESLPIEPSLLKHYKSWNRINRLCKAGDLCFACRAVKDYEKIEFVGVDAREKFLQKCEPSSAAELEILTNERNEAAVNAKPTRRRGGGRKRKPAAISIATAMKMSAFANLSHRVLIKLMRTAKAGGVGTPMARKLDDAFAAASSIFDEFYTSYTTDRAETYGCVWFCNNVSTMLKMICTCCRYNFDEIKLVKINADDGQNMLKVKWTTCVCLRAVYCQYATRYDDVFLCAIVRAREVTSTMTTTMT